MRTPNVNQSFPLNALVLEYGHAIGDTLPKDVGFVLLLFQGGKHPGICYQTNCTADAVGPVLTRACAELEAGRITPNETVKQLATECGEEIVKVCPEAVGFVLLIFVKDNERTEVAPYTNVVAENVIVVMRAFLDQIDKATKLEDLKSGA